MTACHKIPLSVRDEIASTFQSFKSLMDRMQGPPTIPSRAASMPLLLEPSQDCDGEDNFQSMTSYIKGLVHRNVCIPQT